jgi:hypothetical protein
MPSANRRVRFARNISEAITFVLQYLKALLEPLQVNKVSFDFLPVLDYPCWSDYRDGLVGLLTDSGIFGILADRVRKVYGSIHAFAIFHNNLATWTTIRPDHPHILSQPYNTRRIVLPYFQTVEAAYKAVPRYLGELNQWEAYMQFIGSFGLHAFQEAGNNALENRNELLRQLTADADGTNPIIPYRAEAEDQMGDFTDAMDGLSMDTSRQDLYDVMECMNDLTVDTDRRDFDKIMTKMDSLGW